MVDAPLHAEILYLIKSFCRVFDTHWGWVSSLKKIFHYILDIYGYHIYWYIFRVANFL